MTGPSASLDRFDVSFLDGLPPYEPYINCIQITIGRFVETMDSGCEYWSRKQYEQHWVSELDNLLGLRASGVLITWMIDPQQDGWITTWPMWREGETIFVQNRLLDVQLIEGEFSVADLPVYIGERRVDDEEGNKISTWVASCDAIAEFLKRKSFGSVEEANASQG